MPPPVLRPDSLLHIYYIEGRIPASCQLSGPDFIGNWEEDGFSFLFYRRPADAAVAAVIAAQPHLRLLDQYEMSYEQWQGGAITPVRIGRFLLNPPWIKASPEPGDVAITLDSGVVFGNGMHPTTQDCLTAIGIAMAGGKVASMIDLGTGTGILALAAAKLGCAKILAVDLNELAVRTTANNVRINGLQQIILPVVGRAEEQMGVPADLLVANIHYQIMAQIIASDDFLRQKWFVLSGLLRSEEEKVLARLQQMPVAILKRWQYNQVWHTILGITSS